MYKTVLKLVFFRVVKIILGLESRISLIIYPLQQHRLKTLGFQVYLVEKELLVLSALSFKLLIMLEIEYIDYAAEKGRFLN